MERRYEPNFFSNGVISCGKTSSDNAKCLPNGLLSGTRFGVTSKGNKYNHCDFTEKLLKIETSSRKGSTYSKKQKKLISTRRMEKFFFLPTFDHLAKIPINLQFLWIRINYSDQYIVCRTSRKSSSILLI